MSGKYLSKTDKNMVLNTLAYFEEEKKHKEPLLPYHNVQHRVCAALGIATTTLSRIIKENKEGVLRSPKRLHNKKKTVTRLDEFQRSAIRRCIYSLCKEEKRITVKKLLKTLTERNLFHGSQSSLLKILHDLEFSWKAEDNSRYLLEKEEIAEARYLFLKKYIENKKSYNPLPIIFLDETCIFQKGAPVRSWQDKPIDSGKKPKGDCGRRYIVVHAGGRDGFVKEAQLIFASKQNDGNYHREINSNNYINWLKFQLLPAINEPSLIIIDDAPYNSELLERIPNRTWAKKDIQDWLNQKNIDFEDSSLKQDLLLLVKRNKPDETYLVDSIIQEAGHFVLRLPAYHCHFSAIEMIWGVSKAHYNRSIGTLVNNSHDDVMRFWSEAVEQITPEMWSNCIDYTEQVIQEAWDEEVRLDSEDIHPIMINIVENDSTDDDEMDESS